MRTNKNSATNRQAAQILGIKKATDKKRAEVEALHAPAPGPKTATQLQAEEILGLGSKWQAEPELATGKPPKGRRQTSRDRNDDD